MNGAQDLGAMMGFGPIAIEQDEPWFHAEYLTSSDYEIRTKGVERLVVAAGLVGGEELRLGQPLAEPAPIKRMLEAEDVAAVLARSGPTERPIEQPARFAVGDRVRTRNMHPRGHTRLPRYARSRTGVVELVHGAHVFPDTNAHGQGEQAEPAISVSIDAWESYIEPA